MRPREPRFEVAGGQRLPLGGINGYVGVRGKQGKKKNKFQGITPKKKHRTEHFDTAQEAAIALAQLREDLELGMLEPHAPKIMELPAGIAVAQPPVLGGAPGALLQWPQAGVPQVRAVLLSEQQAAAAAARGVAMAVADLL